MKAARYLQKYQLYQKIALGYKRGGGGAYIGHPMYENTIKPNILAKLKDKGVIHQK